MAKGAAGGNLNSSCCTGRNLRQPIPFGFHGVVSEYLLRICHPLLRRTSHSNDRREIRKSYTVIVASTFRDSRVLNKDLIQDLKVQCPLLDALPLGGGSARVAPLQGSSLDASAMSPTLCHVRLRLAAFLPDPVYWSTSLGVLRLPPLRLIDGLAVTRIAAIRSKTDSVVTTIPSVSSCAAASHITSPEQARDSPFPLYPAAL